MIFEGADDLMLEDRRVRVWPAVAAALGVLLCTGLAFAQTTPVPNVIGSQYLVTPPTVSDKQLVPIQIDSHGVQAVNVVGGTGAATTANQGTPAVVGNAWPVTLAIGGALNAVGNPVFVSPGTGANFAGAAPMQATGGVVGLAAGSQVIGHVIVDTTSTTAVTQATASSLNATVVGTGTFATQSTLGAGSAIAGKFGIDQTTPITTNGINVNPTTASAAAITPVVSPSAESNRVICAGACNLWSVSITTGAAAGFFMVFNATSAPADGAVTPIECVQVPANGSASINFGPGPPDRYSTGATAVFSTTGCFNKTASATAFFKGRGV
jgi:hypothetical protein